QWKQAPEGIPKAGIRKHVPGMNAAVVGAVMDDLAVTVDFIESAGEEYRTVKAGIEGTQVIDVIVFHLDAAKYVIPSSSPLFGNAVEGVASKFLQVALGLLNADKRGGDAGMDLFTALGPKAHKGTGM